MGCKGNFCICAYCRFVLVFIINTQLMLPHSIGSSLDLLGHEFIQSQGQEIIVGGYSVPIVCDWNNDDRKDLIIGEQPTSSTGKIRIYLNTGTEANPIFNSYFYVQSNGSDLVLSGAGCLGAAPCIVYCNSLGRKDLLVGTANGQVLIYHNVGTDYSPTFDGGIIVVGTSGAIDVGDRAIPAWEDWNDDGIKDLIIGALDGRLRLYINSGTNAAPVFLTVNFIQCNGADLIVPSGRSAPAICDFDADGKKDIVTGNTNGRLLFYHNIGTDADPCFADYFPLNSTGNHIELLPTGLRTRPFVCDWDNDGLCDILSGYGDSKIHLFRGTFFGDLDYNKSVDMHDFGIFSQYWLGTGDLSCDISPVYGDGIVDIFDLAVLIENWLIGISAG